jgi:hypothetical protein
VSSNSLFSVQLCNYSANSLAFRFKCTNRTANCRSNDRQSNDSLSDNSGSSNCQPDDKNTVNCCSYNSGSNDSQSDDRYSNDSGARNS